jgi:hypothetical protein
MIQRELNATSGNKAFLNTRPGDGLNAVMNPLHIGDTEASSMSNLCSKKYPSLCTRPLRYKILDIAQSEANLMKTWVNPNTTLGSIPEFHEIAYSTDGTKLLWTRNVPDEINVLKEIDNPYGAGNWQFECFNTGTEKFVIVCGVVDTETVDYNWIYNGTTVEDCTVETGAHSPTAHKNRLFWASKNRLIYSGLNKPNDYTTINDAGFITIAQAKGYITAIASYNDTLIVFTNSEMYLLYGSTPTQYAETYSLVKVEGGVGCRSRNEICIANKRLYWMAHDGIYEMSAGSTPIKISEPYYQGGNLVNGVTGGINIIPNGSLVDTSLVFGMVGYNDKLFVLPRSYADADRKKGYTPYGKMFVFDINYRKWYIEDSGGYALATSFVSDLIPYRLEYNNLLLSTNLQTDKSWGYVGQNDTPVDGINVPFEYVSKLYCDGNISQDCSFGELWISVSLISGSFGVSLLDENDTTIATLKAFEEDGGTPVETVTANDKKFRMLHFKPPGGTKNLSFYKIKISGSADIQIHLIERHIRKIGD